MYFDLNFQKFMWPSVEVRLFSESSAFSSFVSVVYATKISVYILNSSMFNYTLDARMFSLCNACMYLVKVFIYNCWLFIIG